MVRDPILAGRLAGSEPREKGRLGWQAMVWTIVLRFWFRGRRRPFVPKTMTRKSTTSNVIKLYYVIDTYNNMRHMGKLLA